MNTNEKTVIVYDERIEQCVNAPGKTVMPVDGSVHLSTLVGQLKTYCAGGGFRLLVFCHGLGAHHRGGLGLQLCEENLTLHTVKYLRPLHGLFGKGILLDVCGAAAQQKPKYRRPARFPSPSPYRHVGDGQFLCASIAKTLGGTLEAPDKKQYSGDVDVDGITYMSETRWRGQVFMWDANGTFLGKHHGGRKDAQDRITPP